VDGLALFATPVFTFPDVGDPALDRDLVARLVAESTATPGVARANRGGWHSLPDLGQRPEPCFQDLLRRIVGRVQAMFVELAGPPQLRYRYGMHAWAMVMRDGDHTIVHDHADAHFSLAYYPDAGDTELADHPESGRLTFVDPRRGGTVIPGVELFPTQFSIAPRTGTLVIFPGWLQHYVQPYRGQRPRVTISANVRIDAG